MVGYKRSKKHSDFAGSASYGVCVSRNLKYFGYKLVLLSTREGLPVAYELVPAHTDERAAADTVLSVLWHCDVVGDKGFLGPTGNRPSGRPRATASGPPPGSINANRTPRP